MEVFDFNTLLESQQKAKTKGIISIGVFDGLHKGHQSLLEEMNLLKTKFPDSETIVITFNVNPKPGLPRNIDTLRIRVENIKSYDIDNLVVIDFSTDFSKISGGEFVKMLTRLCEPQAVVVGFDFRCGYPEEAVTANDLHQLFLDNGKKVEIVIKQAILTEGGEKISSTLVRRVIDKGEVGCIPKLTGQNYRVDLSSSKGVLEICRKSIHQLLPPVGVYGTKLVFSDLFEVDAVCLVKDEMLVIEETEAIRERYGRLEVDEGLQLDSIYFLEKRK